MEKLEEDKSRKKIKNLDEVELNGVKIPLQTAKLKNAFHRVDDLKTQLFNESSKMSQEEKNSKIYVIHRAIFWIIRSYWRITWCIQERESLRAEEKWLLGCFVQLSDKLLQLDSLWDAAGEDQIQSRHQLLPGQVQASLASRYGTEAIKAWQLEVERNSARVLEIDKSTEKLVTAVGAK